MRLFLVSSVVGLFALFSHGLPFYYRVVLLSLDTWVLLAASPWTRVRSAFIPLRVLALFALTAWLICISPLQGSQWYLDNIWPVLSFLPQIEKYEAKDTVQAVYESVNIDVE
jgi:hypothetical protein